MWLCFLCLAILSYQIVKWFLRKLHISDYNARHVLVTGSATGFGNRLVKQLDKLGVPVFACCLTEHAQKKLCTECFNDVFPEGLDVTKDESVKRCLKTVKEKLGDKGLVFTCFLKDFFYISVYFNLYTRKGQI